ncbi:MAG: hypothetical protein KGS45_10990 [Planctomycetes bacterium]|nr:hypothetical protein [Planctomycetota bacterium]
MPQHSAPTPTPTFLAMALVASAICFVAAILATVAVFVSEHSHTDRALAVSEWTANSVPPPSPQNEPPLQRTVLKQIQEPFPSSDRASIRNAIDRNLRISPIDHAAKVASVLALIAAAGSMIAAICCYVRGMPRQ